MKRLVVFSILALLMVIGKDAYAGEKYAFVDVAKLFDEYEKTKDNDTELQSKGQAKESERNAIVEEIRKMKDELELLSDDAKKTKQDEITAKVRQLQDFDVAARRELGETRKEVVQGIFSDIDEVVQSYGKKHGYDFILNDKALVYKKDKFDITEDVLKELNKGYKKA